MTDKEFRHLRRADLIEIIYELQKNERTLHKENEILKKQLEDRRIAIENSGSMAEVLAKLNGLFEAAQATADNYRENAKVLLEEAQNTKEKADAYFAEIKQKAVRLARTTMLQREEMLEKTREECQQLMTSAKEDH